METRLFVQQLVQTNNEVDIRDLPFRKGIHGEFHTWKVSNAENVYMPWRHYQIAENKLEIMTPEKPWKK